MDKPDDANHWPGLPAPEQQVEQQDQQQQQHVMGERILPNKISYSGIASINKSVRDTSKNVLEIRLEKTDRARFSLSMEETESLLVKLGIKSSELV